MGLNGALLIGRSAILSSQAAISVAGNNMANAATPGYHRQIASLAPSRPEAIATYFKPRPLIRNDLPPRGLAHRTQSQSNSCYGFRSQ